jgi:pSer/pThr/pTyr-binding forkhead associated (FHA) protein
LPQFVIGRDAEADAILLDINISRKHATLRFDRENNRWTITDHKVTSTCRRSGTDVATLKIFSPKSL